MILLDAEGVKKHFGPEPVLDGVTLQVRPGERIGLLGPNGSGKTTLLRILAGKEDADSGSVRIHASTHLEYLEQQPHFEPGRTLWEEAASALAGLIGLEREALAVAEAIGEAGEGDERDRLSARYDHLQQELQHRDAYNLEHKIERVLAGVGFAKESHGRPVDSLSGGEQNRLMLARLLLAEPNLMLLDEPSNHLDIEATEWLEAYLLENSAAMIVVSHDRYFLDRVTGRCLELFRGTVESYPGNFSAYWRQKAERLEVERRTYEKQQIEIAKAKEFIRRNAYGQKHTQAEDRRKKLARIEPVEPPREIACPAMSFGEPRRSGDIVLRAKQLSKAYDRPLFADVGLQITRGQRWGLLGPNGCGKTTLLQCLLGMVPADRGDVHLGAGVEVGYFDQQLAELDEETAVVEAVGAPSRERGGMGSWSGGSARADEPPMAPGLYARADEPPMAPGWKGPPMARGRKKLSEQERRDLLARFGVRGETALQCVGSLSGGERCRAALARLAAAGANFLVLDEPTNHLDLWARDALEGALNSFEGTVLFVSHDRHFVNRVADHLLVIEPDRVRVVDGDYATYQDLVGGKSQTSAPVERKPSEDAGSATGVGARDRGRQPARRRRRFPYRKVDELEKEIFAREKSLGELHEALARGETHRDGERVRQIKAEMERQREALGRLYEHWEEATELNW